MVKALASERLTMRNALEGKAEIKKMQPADAKWKAKRRFLIGKIVKPGKKTKGIFNYIRMCQVLHRSGNQTM